MRGRFVADKAGAIALTDTFPEHLQSSLINNSSCKAASGAFGHILLQQIASPPFTIGYNIYCFNQADQLHIEADGPMLELHFNLGASINYHFDGLGNLTFKKNSFNLVYLPALKNILFFTKETPYQTLSIQFTADYLATLLSNYPIIKSWMKKVQALEPALLFTTCLPVQAEMNTIIKEILTIRYTGELLQNFLNLRIADILCLCLRNNLYEQPVTFIQLWENDLEAIERIRRLLFENMNKEFSTAELAAMAGMNKNKLARGFRQVVGMPLLNYQGSIRMIKAKSMLLSTAASITIIGYELGYRDVQAFSKAFKKHFGLSPTIYRRKYGVPLI